MTSGSLYRNSDLLVGKVGKKCSYTYVGSPENAESSIVLVAPGRGIASLHEGDISVKFNVGYHLFLGPVVYCPRRLLNTSTTITMMARVILMINTMATTPPIIAVVLSVSEQDIVSSIDSTGQLSEPIMYHVYSTDTIYTCMWQYTSRYDDR